MPLKMIGTIAIPGGAGSDFDHAAFDANSRRVFIAHTARDCIEVIDHDAGRHIETVDPRTGEGTRTVTGADAHTTALVAPDRLYVISPAHGGILMLSDA